MIYHPHRFFRVIYLKNTILEDIFLELFPDKFLHEICLHFRLLMYCVLTKFRSNVPAKILL